MRERGRKTGSNGRTLRQRPLEQNRRRSSSTIATTEDTGATCPICGKIGFKNVKLHQTKSRCGMSSSQPCPPTEGRRQSSQSTCPPQKAGSQEKTHSAPKSTGKSFHHKKKTREEAHQACRNLAVKDYINLPKSSEDSIWKALDEQLYNELPTEIGGSPDEQLSNLETHVYKKLVERFGTKPASSRKKDTKHSTRQQRKLRRLKKNVKQQYKKALKDGNNTQSANLRKDYLKLVRLHNKVRKLELKAKEKEAASKAHQQFRQNPYQYAKSMLDDKQQRKPSFIQQDNCRKVLQRSQ